MGVGGWGEGAEREREKESECVNTHAFIPREEELGQTRARTHTHTSSAPNSAPKAASTRTLMSKDSVGDDEAKRATRQSTATISATSRLRVR